MAPLGVYCIVDCCVWWCVCLYLSFLVVKEILVIFHPRRRVGRAAAGSTKKRSSKSKVSSMPCSSCHTVGLQEGRAAVAPTRVFCTLPGHRFGRLDMDWPAQVHREAPRVDDPLPQEGAGCTHVDNDL